MPLLFCSGLISPALNPWDFAAEGMAKVHGGFVQGKLFNRWPKFQVISLTAAFVTEVSPRGQVHRKRSTAGGQRVMDWARSVQLVAGSTRWLEAKLVQYLFHRDLRAKHMEVNTWHSHRVSWRPSRWHREKAAVLRGVLVLTVDWSTESRVSDHFVKASNASGLR